MVRCLLLNPDGTHEIVNTKNWMCYQKYVGGMFEAVCFEKKKRFGNLILAMYVNENGFFLNLKPNMWHKKLLKVGVLDTSYPLRGNILVVLNNEVTGEDLSMTDSAIECVLNN